MRNQFKGKLTVIVPAYNESASIADTIKSLQEQTHPPDKIIVVDDCSTDDTYSVAQSMGVAVIKPLKNTGSKAGAQNYALKLVDTEYSMAIDADTTLAKDAIEKILPAMNEENVAAACGFVRPRFVRTIWERGRYIEYLFAFSFYKQVQDYYGKPFISSGCFSVYKTKILKECGGWSERTRAEDMDLTWTFYQKGYKVRFIPTAVCYPIEPENFNFMKKQLRRWSHGFIQNVRLHWKDILGINYLRYLVAIALWDAVIASIAYLFLLPIFAIIFHQPLILLGYVIDLPAVLIPILFHVFPKRETFEVLISIPAFFILRTVNAVFMLEAMWSEFITHKSLLVYEKGH
jgi:biofilm PGA synthesis N-glycosyltransferase PgaC